MGFSKYIVSVSVIILIRSDIDIALLFHFGRIYNVFKPSFTL